MVNYSLIQRLNLRTVLYEKLLAATSSKLRIREYFVETIGERPCVDPYPPPSFSSRSPQLRTHHSNCYAVTLLIRAHYFYQDFYRQD